MPEPPQGTGSAAFSGGGVAHLGGPNAVFSNPAALSISDGFQAEAGMMGLASGVSPYFLYGSGVGDHAAYAMGYFFDERVDPATSGPARQGLIAGGSWEVGPKVSLGLAVHSAGTGEGVGLEGFGIDMDAGILYRPRQRWWMGFTSHNLQESGVGHEPEGYRSRRNYMAAFGLRTSVMDVWKLRLRDPDIFYELRLPRFPAMPSAHALSVGSSFLPGGTISLRGTVLVPDGHDPGFAVGAFLLFPAGAASILGGYTFDTGAGESMLGGKTPSHSLSLNLRVGALGDNFPPVVEVKADQQVVEVDSADGVLVHFRLTASDKTVVASGGEAEEKGIKGRSLDNYEGGMRDYGRPFEEGPIKDWKLMVRAVSSSGKAGPQVKAFAGMDLPPRIIRWDAKNEAGKVVAPGMYAFAFSARDYSGNEGVTHWQLLDLKVPTSGTDSLPASP